MKGKKLLASVLAIGLFFMGTLSASALSEINLSPFVIMPIIEVGEPFDPSFVFYEDEEMGDMGITEFTSESTELIEYEVATLTKEKYDEIVELEEVYNALLEDEDADPADVEAAKEALEAALMAECDDLEETHDWMTVVTLDDLGWVDCEQESYILVFARISGNGAFYDGYKVQSFTNPEVCKEAPLPEKPTTTDNPKTGISDPYVLGALGTAVAGSGLLLSRKKRFV